MPVAVWLDKRTVGWTGTQDEMVGPRKVEMHAVFDTVDAMELTWSSDAHFTCGILHHGGEAVKAQPRMMKANGALERAKATLGENFDVLFDTLVVDADFPNKKKVSPTPEQVEEWSRAEIAKIPQNIRGGMGWYMTKGGFRLIWRLPVQVRSAQWESWLQAMFDVLSSADMSPDRAVCDWTRGYRLPKVVRDGEMQSFPMDLTGYKTGVLRTALLEERVSDSDASIANTRMAIDLVSVTPDGNRNDFLFRTGCKFWDRDWIPGSLLRPILDAINFTQCVPPLDEDEIDRIQRNIEKYEKPVITKVRHKAGELLREVDESIELLATHPDIYVQEGTLVRVKHTGIEDILPDALGSMAAEHISYVTKKKDKTKKKGEEGEYYDVVIDPPAKVLKGIIARSKYPGYKGLKEVLVTPVMLPSGAIVNEPSYAAEIEAAVIVGTTIERVPSAQEGLAILEDLISEISFATDADRSVALAAILTPVVRTAIPGPIPMIIIESNTPGGGKSMLADVAAIIATGRNAGMMPPTRDEETEKRITSYLRRGDRVICIDNVDQKSPLGGAALDALLTSETWTGRVLGRSDMVSCRNRALWMATGNNIRLEGDLPRRVIRCYIDPKTEKPEEREFQKVKPSIRAMENRSYYLAAALGVIQGYLRYGKEPKLPNFGSFEGWSKVVRSALVWLGRPDPVQTRAAYSSSGPTPIWGRALLCLYEMFDGAKTFMSRDIIQILDGDRRSGPTAKAHDGFVDAVQQLLGDAEPTPHRIAALLAQWKNRIVNGRVLRLVADDRHLGNAYRVELADAPPMENIPAPVLAPVMDADDEIANAKAAY